MKFTQRARVGPGHPLYSYDETNYDGDLDSTTCVCGAHVQYTCTQHGSRWCRGCFDVHLNLTHNAELVSEQEEMES